MGPSRSVPVPGTVNSPVETPCRPISHLQSYTSLKYPPTRSEGKRRSTWKGFRSSKVLYSFSRKKFFVPWGLNLVFIRSYQGFLFCCLGPLLARSQIDFERSDTLFLLRIVSVHDTSEGKLSMSLFEPLRLTERTSVYRSSTHVFRPRLSTRQEIGAEIWSVARFVTPPVCLAPCLLHELFMIKEGIFLPIPSS